MWYILDRDNKPIEADPLVYIDWIHNNPSRKAVKQESIGDVRVSTVFLGLNHSYEGGEPVLWETMVFEGSLDGYQERYTSYEEALTGHEFAVQMVKNNQLKEKL